MRNLKLIILREYLTRVRHKTFVIMTFVSPVVFVGLIALVAYLISLNQEDKTRIAVKDEVGVFQGYSKKNDGMAFVNYNRYNVDRALDSVKANGFDGLLFIPDKNLGQLQNTVQLFFNGPPSESLISTIESRLSNSITQKRLAEENIDINAIEKAKTKVNLITENMAGQKTSSLVKYVKIFFGGAAGYMIMMFIVIYGNMIMRSVIEEKTNRIVEIIISSVRPIQLMLGKIAGNTLAGLTQFLIWVVFGGILLVGIGLVFDLPMASSTLAGAPKVNPSEIQMIFTDILRLPLLKLALTFLVYFVGGYLLYSGVYAAIGGAVDSETDTQQFIFPILIPLLLGIYVGFFSVIENPNSTMAVIFSHIPLTSPVVMLMRIPFGVPWWEILISVSLLIATMIGTIWLGAKIYRVGILMHGSKPSYKDLYKWMKQKN